ncbi:hypothetical protein QYF61_016054 [Mycteria americana]|uniref:Uncharacterized protein n=1 Tax=Mycteria americana TaxID=33587 RepID=A0AAN7PH91_MYCAM|nr:hypothetical protein QYF61_016054 [Mycteria americana]
MVRGVTKERILMKERTVMKARILTLDFRQVEVNGSYSNWRLITNRVPERSNLGTVVFNVFINGLEKAVECTLNSFGDYTKLRTPVNMLDSRAAIQEDKLKEWADRKLMNFNRAKYEDLHMERKNPLQ